MVREPAPCIWLSLNLAPFLPANAMQAKGIMFTSYEIPVAAVAELQALGESAILLPRWGLRSRSYVRMVMLGESMGT